MKKPSLFLITACILAILASCTDSDIQVNSPQSTANAGTTAVTTSVSAAITAAATAPQTAEPETFPHRLDQLYWAHNFSTPEEQTAYIRSYFKSAQYAEDHPDYPDVLWIPDNGRVTVPEVEYMPSNDTFVEPCILDALEDDEKIGLFVYICREDPQQTGAADLQAEKEYFTSEGFTAVGDVSGYPYGFAIIIQKSQYEALAALVPYEPGVDHYLIGLIGYSDLIRSDTQ